MSASNRPQSALQQISFPRFLFFSICPACMLRTPCYMPCEGDQSALENFCFCSFFRLAMKNASSKLQTSQATVCTAETRRQLPNRDPVRRVFLAPSTRSTVSQTDRSRKEKDTTQAEASNNCSCWVLAHPQTSATFPELNLSQCLISQLTHRLICSRAPKRRV